MRERKRKRERKYGQKTEAAYGEVKSAFLQPRRRLNRRWKNRKSERKKEREEERGCL